MEGVRSATMNNRFQSQQCPVTSKDYIVPYGTSGWVGRGTHTGTIHLPNHNPPPGQSLDVTARRALNKFGMKTHAFAPRPSFLPADTTKSNCCDSKTTRRRSSKPLECLCTTCSHFSSNQNPFSLLEDGEGNQTLHLIPGGLQSQQCIDAHIACWLQAPCSQEKCLVLKKANEGDPS